MDGLAGIPPPPAWQSRRRSQSPSGQRGRRLSAFHPLPLPLLNGPRTNVSDPSIDDRYPGSKMMRRAVAPVVQAPVENVWDGQPVIKRIRGQQVELFTVGQLGMALGRAAVTMRLWERNGVLPKARIRLNNKNGIGGRRYYTRGQVEGIARIAQEEGLLEPRARLTPAFTDRVKRLFIDLEKG